MAKPQNLRLLNVSTFAFQSKFDIDRIPGYAILSKKKSLQQCNVELKIILQDFRDPTD